MPFSSSQSGNYEKQLDEILIKLDNLSFDGVIGNPSLDYIQGLVLSLDGTLQQLVRAEDAISDKSYVRDFYISNTSDAELLIYVGKSVVPFRIPPGGSLKEQFNKQAIFVQGSGVGEIEVIVQSNFKIFTIPIIGDEDMPIPVKIRLMIGTGSNFEMPFTTFQEDNYNYTENALKFLGSEQGIDGWKMAAFEMFQPGQQLEFNVEIEGNSYELGRAVGFQWIDIERVYRLIAVVASDLINPESEMVDSAIAGALSHNQWASTVEQGKLKIYPTFFSNMGRFIAINPATQRHDTAIIKSYIPNADPYQGGTFILEGF